MYLHEVLLSRTAQENYYPIEVSVRAYAAEVDQIDEIVTYTTARGKVGEVTATYHWVVTDYYERLIFQMPNVVDWTLNNPASSHMYPPSWKKERWNPTDPVQDSFCFFESDQGWRPARWSVCEEENPMIR